MRKPPSYRKHPNGQAFVQYQGKRHYLGVYGSEKSLRRYRQFLARISPENTTPQRVAPHGQETVSVLIAAYLGHAESYYSKDGKPTKEYVCVRSALSVLERLYGETIAAEFSPRDLVSIQSWMIGRNHGRTFINNHVGRIKRFWKWCSREGYVKPDLYHGLLCVDGLKRGRCGAKELPPVRPVHPQWVSAVLPYVSPPVAAMIRVQYFCGMRPEEVCMMRPCDLDMTGDIWLYRPADHKNAWRGHELVKAIPRVAQEIIRPFLARPTDAFLFSPREADEWHRENRKVPTPGRIRKTPVYPSELRQREKAKAARRQRERKRPPRQSYDTDSYRRAIYYGFRRARAAKVEIPPWSPNQLRHGIATEIDRTLGRQAAQRWLGHSTMDTTAIYAEHQVEDLIEIARKLDQRWSA